MILINSGQLLLFFKFIILGVLLGALFGIFKFISMFIKFKRAYFIVTDLLFCLALTGVFLLYVNLLNYGEIRLYLLLAYFLGLILQRKTIGKLFAKLYILIYNAINKANNAFKNTRVYKFISK